MKITDFLTSRLNEDEDIALDAAPGRWRIVTENEEGYDGSDTYVGAGDITTDPYTYPVQTFTGHEPGTGRAIYTPGTMTSTYVAQTEYDDQSSTIAYTAQTAAHIVRHSPHRVLADIRAKRRMISHAGLIADPLLLRLLALPYADHPDYREEWRP